MTSADCVRVTSPISLRSSWVYPSTTHFSTTFSTTYLPTTTTYTLSNPTGIDFGKVPITGVGYGKGDPLNGHEYFLSHFKSCLGSFALPTDVSPGKDGSTTCQGAARLPLGADIGIGVGAGVVCFVVLALVLRAAKRCRHSKSQPGRRVKG
jgi:hypothetical protein